MLKHVTPCESTYLLSTERICYVYERSLKVYLFRWYDIGQGCIEDGAWWPIYVIIDCASLSVSHPTYIIYMYCAMVMNSLVISTHGLCHDMNMLVSSLHQHPGLDIVIAITPYRILVFVCITHILPRVIPKGDEHEDDDVALDSIETENVTTIVDTVLGSDVGDGLIFRQQESASWLRKLRRRRCCGGHWEG